MPGMRFRPGVLGLSPYLIIVAVTVRDGSDLKLAAGLSPVSMQTELTIRCIIHPATHCGSNHLQQGYVFLQNAINFANTNLMMPVFLQNDKKQDALLTSSSHYFLNSASGQISLPGK